MCRLMTTQLEEALKGYPLYSQDGKGKDAICRAIFALGGVRWFILEGEKEGNDTILFGSVIGLMEDEYGYISLNELSDIELDLTRQGFGKLQVRQQENFQPVPLIENVSLYVYEEGNRQTNNEGHPVPVQTGLTVDGTYQTILKAQSFILLTNID